MKKRLVVGLSGASGAILCVSLLEAMRKEKDWEVHLVASEAGERVLREETGMNGNDLARLAFRTHDIGNIGAAIASGTFETEGMAVVPCSMKTLAGICHGYAETCSSAPPTSPSRNAVNWCSWPAKPRSGSSTCAT